MLSLVAYEPCYHFTILSATRQVYFYYRLNDWISSHYVLCYLRLWGKQKQSSCLCNSSTNNNTTWKRGELYSIFFYPYIYFMTLVSRYRFRWFSFIRLLFVMCKPSDNHRAVTTDRERMLHHCQRSTFFHWVQWLVCPYSDCRYFTLWTKPKLNWTCKEKCILCYWILDYILT